MDHQQVDEVRDQMYRGQLHLDPFLVVRHPLHRAVLVRHPLQRAVLLVRHLEVLVAVRPLARAPVVDRRQPNQMDPIQLHAIRETTSRSKLVAWPEPWPLALAPGTASTPSTPSAAASTPTPTHQHHPPPRTNGVHGGNDHHGGSRRSGGRTRTVA